MEDGRAMRAAAWMASGVPAWRVGPAAAADPPCSTCPTTRRRRSTTAWAGQPHPRPRRPPPQGGRGVGKVAGRDLAGAGADQIAARLRAGWRGLGAGIVGVDEIVWRQWSPAGARALAAALARLGPDARRWRPTLPWSGGSGAPTRGGAWPPLSALVGAMSRGRATYLQTARRHDGPVGA